MSKIIIKNKCSLTIIVETVAVGYGSFEGADGIIFSHCELVVVVVVHGVGIVADDVRFGC